MSGFSIKANNSLFKRPQGAKLAMGQPKAPGPPKPAHVGELFGAEEDEQAAKRARTESAPPPAAPGLVDAETQEVATKLADFVAKNGAQFEDLTRERNPGPDTPFSFLQDKSSPGYQFYAARLREFQAAAAGGAPPPPPPPHTAGGGDAAGSRRPAYIPPPSSGGGPSSSSAAASAAAAASGSRSNRWGQGPPSASPPPQPPPPPGGAAGASVFSALPPEAAAAVAAAAAAAKAAAAAGRLRSFSPSPSAELSAEAKEEAEAEARRRAQIALAQGDSVAAMEAFAKLAARRDRGRSASVDPDEPGSGAGDDDDDEARRRRAEPLLNKTAFERRKVTAVYKDDGSRGHHMGDYIPKEVLAEFMAKTGDKIAKVQAEQLANKNAIGSDNIGHKLLSKMGWKEGEGLGGTQKGITAPIKASAGAPAAGEQRGLGATAVGEVTEEDDMFEAYRKRMMLGYKYRPNPLGNPRRAYY